MRHGGSKPAHYLQRWARRQRTRLSKGKEKGPGRAPRDEGWNGCTRSRGNRKCGAMGACVLCVLFSIHHKMHKGIFYSAQREKLFFLFKTQFSWLHRGQQLSPFLLLRSSVTVAYPQDPASQIHNEYGPRVSAWWGLNEALDKGCFCEGKKGGNVRFRGKRKTDKRK